MKSRQNTTRLCAGSFTKKFGFQTNHFSAVEYRGEFTNQAAHTVPACQVLLEYHKWPSWIDSHDLVKALGIDS
ncbi:MAG: hypothetical protein UY03_C0010G0003 [Parcubacteria group bacterium GW2011_GWA2_47_64]|nr:MAG: hypothetical protein UY03_C0010G0003 [Parcubacteria group bacterium GW2011_GWA2_47_64]KKU97133.1 MAG: hypothetical protein UY29_C0002G0030 [Parcubacteria group bacterium GW2011_GWC2_48_17]